MEKNKEKIIAKMWKVVEQDIGLKDLNKLLLNMEKSNKAIYNQLGILVE